MLWKSRTDFSGMQVIADEHLRNNEVALAAVSSWLSKWYSPENNEVIDFLGEAGIKPGEIISRESKNYSGPGKMLVEVAYYPPGKEAPPYVDALAKKGTNQNRWYVNTFTGAFEI